MADKNSQSLFRRLTLLFRSGPVIKRRVKDFESGSGTSSAFDMFRRNQSHVYSTAMSAYGTYDRMARYSDFCLTGDTLIATNTEEGVISIRDIVSKFENGETVCVFSYDKETDSTVLAPVENAWQTVEDEIYEITFDNGTTLRCTGNHPIMLRNGEYCRTDAIQPNTAVMPFYRKKFDSKRTGGNYRWVYGFSRGWKPEHVLVAEYSNNRSIEKADGLHVHHKNFIKEDNRIENLELMDAKEHLALHARINNKRFEDPKEREKQSSHMTLRWSLEGDLRKNQKENLAKRKLTDGYRKNVAETILRNKTNPPGTGNKGRQDQKALQNANADRSFTAQNIYDEYVSGDTLTVLSKKLNQSKYKVLNRLKWEGYKSFDDFESLYVNHKIINVVNTHIVEPVFDITVTKTHNFAVCDTSTKKEMCFVSNSEMEYTPEVSSALDIYSEESIAADEHGNVLHIHSDNQTIKKLLHELFYDTLNVEFNMTSWVRSLVKYGDFFLFNDVSPEHGVINAYPMPVNEVEREEGYDPDDPLAVRFRWITQGNQALENWQVSHMRLLGNDAFLPYGSSVLESARRIWRQLILVEDAMLVYRIVRSPERRVFYVDVGNVPPEDIPTYMEQVQSTLKKASVVDKDTGRVDLRYNPLCNSLNTLLFLQDGRNITLGDLIEERSNGQKDQWVYSIDRDGKKLAPGRVMWAGITKENAKLVRVHLDNNKWLDVTPDHKFMLRNGEYCEAQNLSENDALMPLYKRWSKKGDDKRVIDGYEMIYDPYSQNYVYTHRANIIAESGFEAIKGKVVHHVDFDKTNNSPNNLHPCTWKEHHKIHGDYCVERNKSSAGRKASRKNMINLWEAGKLNPEIYTKMWQNSEIREKRVNALTLKTNSELIHHVIQALNELTTSAREYEVRTWLNNDNNFTSYLRSLNENFENGFNDKLSKGQFIQQLRKNGFKNLREVKDYYASLRAPWKEIEIYASNSINISRNDIIRHFGISRYDFMRILQSHGYTGKSFDTTYLSGGKFNKPNSACRGCDTDIKSYKTFCSQDCYWTWMSGKTRSEMKQAASYANHKVVCVEVLDHTENVGAVTIEGYHNFATPGDSRCFSDDQRIESGVFIKNSVDEDYYLPVRGGESGTKIDTLAGGANATAIEDVEYIQKKLFAALKIPKAYLGYDEGLGAKATLCLRGNTEICLVDGRKLSILDIVNEFNDGKKLKVYSYDHDNKRTTFGNITNAWATKEVTELYRVTLDNGKIVECTDNHPFLMKDGLYTNAEDLSIGESPMTHCEDNLLEDNINSNHKIANIEIVKLDEPELVYDITVDTHHNFALAAEIFVHNSQEDIRFSRTIARIQRTIIAEMNKIAIIHLFCNGFEGEDLLDFTLQLSNPSTIAQQQKLELFRSRFEIAGSASGIEGLVDREWLRRNIFNMTDDEIDKISKGRFGDRLMDLKVEAVHLPGDEPEGADELAMGPESEEPEDEEPAVADLALAGDDRNSSGLDLLTSSGVREFDEIDLGSLSIRDETSPITAQGTVDRLSEVVDDDDDDDDKTPAEVEDEKRKRRRGRNNNVTDHSRIVSHDRNNASDSITHPFGMKQKRYQDRSDLRGLVRVSIPTLSEMDDAEFMDMIDDKIETQNKMTSDVRSSLKSLGNTISNRRRVISENDNSSEED